MLSYSPARYFVVAYRCCYRQCNVIAVCFLLSPAGSALETALLLLFQSFMCYFPQLNSVYGCKQSKTRFCIRISRLQFVFLIIIFILRNAVFVYLRSAICICLFIVVLEMASIARFSAMFLIFLNLLFINWRTFHLKDFLTSLPLCTFKANLRHTIET